MVVSIFVVIVVVLVVVIVVDVIVKIIVVAIVNVVVVVIIVAVAIVVAIVNVIVVVVIAVVVVVVVVNIIVVVVIIVAVVIVVAGGRGLRMGGDMPKQYLPLGGQPVLGRTLACFDAHPLIGGIVLVLHRDDMEYCRQNVLEGAGFTKIRALVAGGEKRSESVRAGLAETEESDEIVLVHDAVRPFVSRALVDRVIAAAVEVGLCSRLCQSKRRSRSSKIAP